MMKRIIGFMPCSDGHDKDAAPHAAPAEDSPVKSLVRLYFSGSSRKLTYYNDRFALREGDVVYVSGKLAGEAGIVISVTTKFRIHTADYERVLAKLDLTVRGSFIRVQDKMVCFDDVAVSPDQFESWVVPPVEKPEDEEPDEVISGEGYEIELNHIDGCEELRPVIRERAVGYCAEGRVRYLCLRKGVGCAFVEGTKWYRVDFRYEDGMMTELFCDCPYPDLCKHEVAAALTLRMLLKQPQMNQAEDFVALDRGLFWQLASRAEQIDL